MISALLNIPRSRTDWLHWSWEHRDSHDRIRAAIQKQKGVVLSDYQIEPINPDAMTLFLQNHQQLHDDMDGVLGLQSNNLQDVNLSDDRQLQSWIYLNWFEHNDAEMALKI